MEIRKSLEEKFSIKLCCHKLTGLCDSNEEADFKSASIIGLNTFDFAYKASVTSAEQLEVPDSQILYT